MAREVLASPGGRVLARKVLASLGGRVVARDALASPGGGYLPGSTKMMPSIGTNVVT